MKKVKIESTISPIPFPYNFNIKTENTCFLLKVRANSPGLEAKEAWFN